MFTGLFPILIYFYILIYSSGTQRKAAVIYAVDSASSSLGPKFGVNLATGESICEKLALSFGFLFLFLFFGHCLQKFAGNIFFHPAEELKT